MDPHAKARFVRDLAASLSFERCGIAPAAPIGRSDYLAAWLQAGRAGSMDYLHNHFTTRADPSTILDGARSVIVVALSYHQRPPPESGISRGPGGRVAMYAWGDDYHEVIRSKLGALVERMRMEVTEPFEARVCVDTTPILERELAAAAGIGWIGKNTMVLHHELGSYFFLGAIVTTLDLAPDEPLPDHCGTCTACLDACPTQAFPKPYEMDASRCISYLTIEHRGDISKPFQKMMGDWVFGCDVCQEVCPYNRSAPTTREPRFAVRLPGPRPALVEILGWSMDESRAQLRGSAMTRAKLDMLQRNARIASANTTVPLPGGAGHARGLLLWFLP
ncbi:MAG: tRNA epoxyqueuosine(34) reductase QueG [Planctomycetota bacterium]